MENKSNELVALCVKQNLVIQELVFTLNKVDRVLNIDLYNQENTIKTPSLFKEMFKLIFGIRE